MGLVELIRTRFRYDPESGKLFWIHKNKHHPRLYGKEAGCVSDGRVFVKVQGKRMPRARVAYIYMTGVIPSLIDHMNGNTLDDRWVNLRVASLSQNNWNISPNKRKSKKSGLPLGVRVLTNGTYQSRIAAHGKTYCLGAFDSAEDAHKAYLEAKLKIHGQFSREVSNAS